jgi:hypothetical protein
MAEAPTFGTLFRAGISFGPTGMVCMVVNWTWGWSIGGVPCGLARGIDREAHKVALEESYPGATVIIMNTKLQAQVAGINARLGIATLAIVVAAIWATALSIFCSVE